jgi:hypothetical protein
VLLMPRSHGRILSAIWNDGDFLALEAGPQRLYLFLLSQPDLSHAGLVPMRVRRWAKKVALGTVASITADLGDLEGARFVVSDEDTEEVLIRTFVRNDGVYKQPKVMMRLREDARQIESAKLRCAFRGELDRLPLDELSEPTKTTVSGIVDTLRADFADAQEYPSEGVSDTHTDTPRVRAGAFPQPPAPSPRPPATVPPTAGRGEPGASLAVVRDEAPTAQTLVGEWIDHCPQRPAGSVVGQVAKNVKAMLDEGIEPERLRRALAEWNRKGLHPSTLPSVLHEIENRAPAARGQQATNDLFDRAMQRALERDGSTR